VRIFILALFALLLAVPAFALDIGVGVVHYTKSDDTSPMVSVSHPTGSILAIVTWSADNDLNDVSMQFALPIAKLDYGLEVQLAGGAGLAWEEWEDWRPSLNYGVALAAPSCGFMMRAGWTRVETGGGREGDNLFFAGVYR
jgi:hypothetical protein